MTLHTGGTPYPPANLDGLHARGIEFRSMSQFADVDQAATDCVFGADDIPHRPQSRRLGRAHRGQMAHRGHIPGGELTQAAFAKALNDQDLEAPADVSMGSKCPLTDSFTELGLCGAVLRVPSVSPLADSLLGVVKALLIAWDVASDAAVAKVLWNAGQQAPAGLAIGFLCLHMLVGWGILACQAYSHWSSTAARLLAWTLLPLYDIAALTVVHFMPFLGACKISSTRWHAWMVEVELFLRQHRVCRILTRAVLESLPMTVLQIVVLARLGSISGALGTQGRALVIQSLVASVLNCVLAAFVLLWVMARTKASMPKACWLSLQYQGFACLPPAWQQRLMPAQPNIVVNVGAGSFTELHRLQQSQLLNAAFTQKKQITIANSKAAASLLGHAPKLFGAIASRSSSLLLAPDAQALRHLNDMLPCAIQSVTHGPAVNSSSSSAKAHRQAGAGLSLALVSFEEMCLQHCSKHLAHTLGLVLPNGLVQLLIRDMDMRADCMQALCRHLPVTTTLRKLVISEAALSEEALVGLCDALAANCSMHHLDLSSNPLSVPSTFGIRRMLQNNSSLQELVLAYTGLEHEGASEVVLGAAESKSLTRLDLSQNHITDILPHYGFAAPMPGRQNPAMARIDLSFNWIQDSMAGWIILCLEHFPHLTHLHLNHNSHQSTSPFSLSRQTTGGSVPGHLSPATMRVDPFDQCSKDRGLEMLAHLRCFDATIMDRLQHMQVLDVRGVAFPSWFRDTKPAGMIIDNTLVYMGDECCMDLSKRWRSKLSSPGCILDANSKEWRMLGRAQQVAAVYYLLSHQRRLLITNTCAAARSGSLFGPGGALADPILPVPPPQPSPVVRSQSLFSPNKGSNSRQSSSPQVLRSISHFGTAHIPMSRLPSQQRMCIARTASGHHSGSVFSLGATRMHSPLNSGSLFGLGAVTRNPPSPIGSPSNMSRAAPPKRLSSPNVMSIPTTLLEAAASAPGVSASSEMNVVPSLSMPCALMRLQHGTSGEDIVAPLNTQPQHAHMGLTSPSVSSIMDSAGNNIATGLVHQADQLVTVSSFGRSSGPNLVNAIVLHQPAPSLLAVPSVGNNQSGPSRHSLTMSMLPVGLSSHAANSATGAAADEPNSGYFGISTKGCAATAAAPPELPSPLHARQYDTPAMLPVVAGVVAGVPVWERATLVAGSFENNRTLRLPLRMLELPLRAAFRKSAAVAAAVAGGSQRPSNAAAATSFDDQSPARAVVANPGSGPHTSVFSLHQRLAVRSSDDYTPHTSNRTSNDCTTNLSFTSDWPPVNTDAPRLSARQSDRHTTVSNYASDDQAGSSIGLPSMMTSNRASDEHAPSTMGIPSMVTSNRPSDEQPLSTHAPPSPPSNYIADDLDNNPPSAAANALPDRALSSVIGTIILDHTIPSKVLETGDAGQSTDGAVCGNPTLQFNEPTKLVKRFLYGPSSNKTSSAQTPASSMQASDACTYTVSNTASGEHAAATSEGLDRSQQSTVPSSVRPKSSWLSRSTILPAVSEPVQLTAGPALDSLVVGGGGPVLELYLQGLNPVQAQQLNGLLALMPHVDPGVSMMDTV